MIAIIECALRRAFGASLGERGRLRRLEISLSLDEREFVL